MTEPYKNQNHKAFPMFTGLVSWLIAHVCNRKQERQDAEVKIKNKVMGQIYQHHHY